MVLTIADLLTIVSQITYKIPKTLKVVCMFHLFQSRRRTTTKPFILSGKFGNNLKSKHEVKIAFSNRLLKNIIAIFSVTTIVAVPSGERE